MTNLTHSINVSNNNDSNNIVITTKIIVLWNNGTYGFVDASDNFPITIGDFQKYWLFDDVVKTLN